MTSSKQLGSQSPTALKKGLLVYRDEALHESRRQPADFFKTFDLGEGGYAVAPAREAGRAIKQVLRQKHQQ